MAVPRVSYLYPDQERVYQEIMQNGGFVASPGLRSFGVEGHDREELRKAARHLRPDGTPMLRQQKNSSTDLYGLIETMASSVSAFYLDLPEKKKEILREELKEGARYYLAGLDTVAGQVRRGAGGKKVEQALLIFFGGLHTSSANGQAHLHFHFFGARAGRTMDGQTYSTYSDRCIERGAEAGSRAFQLHLAEVLETKFGQKVEMRKGKVHLPEIEQNRELMAKVGGRKREIDAYIKEKKLHNTPQARAVASKKTRPKQENTYSREKRHQEWRQAGGTFHQEQTQEQERKPGETGVWGRALSRYLEKLVPDGFAVIARAIRLTYRRKMGHETIFIGNVERLLEDTRKKTRREGHRAALKALHKYRADTLQEALKIAERGYRQGRKPRVKIKKRTKIVVTRKAAERMTGEQKAELLKRAKKHGWKLTIAGQGIEHNVSQEEELRQRRRR